MKIRSLALLAVLTLGLASNAPAAPKAPSKISAFAGPHNGTGVVLGSIGGTTTGQFAASKKKEAGSLTLSTSANLGGTAFTAIEQFTFNKNSVTWSFTLPGLVSGAGTGSAHISKNVITFNIPVALSSVGGGTAVIGTVSGKMTLAKNHSLQILETLSFSTGSGASFYQLNGKKPKK